MDPVRDLVYRLEGVASRSRLRPDYGGPRSRIIQKEVTRYPKIVPPPPHPLPPGEGKFLAHELINSGTQELGRPTIND